MKFIVLFSVFALCACRNTPRWEAKNVVETIKQHGYQVDKYTVQTSDGYMLDLFRIPYGRRANSFVDDNQVMSSESSSQESRERQMREGSNRPAVLLLHGLMGSSEDFVVSGPEQGLAFMMADNGYDVYLGNARGSVYGQKHTTLNPKKDEAFWRFSWHEIGVRDLPAIVDRVVAISGQEKIQFVGHNEGNTAFYVMTSELPQYNEKISKAVSLGPIAFMSHSQNEIINEIAKHMQTPQAHSWIAKNLGLSTFSPSSELLSSVETNCINFRIEERICKNIYFLLNGYNSINLNQTIVKEMLPHFPTVSSVREILHFAQVKASGRFQKYEIDEKKQLSSQAEYDLSKVTVPVALIYTPQDKFSPVEDVQLLVNKLPNVVSQENMQHLRNNVDLIYSEHLEKVNQVVLQFLRQQHQKMTL